MHKKPISRQPSHRADWHGACWAPAKMSMVERQIQCHPVVHVSKNLPKFSPGISFISENSDLKKLYFSFDYPLTLQIFMVY
jgi:hypothetical protein